MKRLHLIISLLCIFLIQGCTSATLSEDEKAVRILRRSDPDKTCKELGNVAAPGLASVTPAGWEADLKRAARSIGGNTVTWDKQDSNNAVYGRAFSCP